MVPATERNTGLDISSAPSKFYLGEDPVEAGPQEEVEN